MKTLLAAIVEIILVDFLGGLYGVWRNMVLSLKYHIGQPGEEPLADYLERNRYDSLPVVLLFGMVVAVGLVLGLK